MIAVVHLVPETGTHGMLPVGGRPLIARQLDWLFALHFQQVIIELGTDSRSREVESFLHDGGVLRQRQERVTIVTCDDRPGPRGLADRAGISSVRSLLAMPSDFLGGGDLGTLFPAANAFGLVAFFQPPKALRELSGGTVRVVRAPLIRHQRPVVVLGPGWGVRLQSPPEATRLATAALRGALPGRGRGHAWTLRPASAAA